MIDKTHLKFYLIPAGLLVIIFLIVLFIPMGSKKVTNQGVVPTPTVVPVSSIPSGATIPTQGPTPTLIPPRFTGLDMNQEIAPDLKLFTEQKTTLRRKCPLNLPFGTLSFNYANDSFILTLLEPKNESQIAFTSWLQGAYSALPIEQFAIQ